MGESSLSAGPQGKPCTERIRMQAKRKEREVAIVIVLAFEWVVKQIESMVFFLIRFSAWPEFDSRLGTTGRFFQLKMSIQAMKRWRDASANGDG
jgi:hypothetical protein